jgi:hypothetical protein
MAINDVLTETRGLPTGLYRTDISLSGTLIPVYITRETKAWDEHFGRTTPPSGTLSPTSLDAGLAAALSQSYESLKAFQSVPEASGLILSYFMGLTKNFSFFFGIPTDSPNHPLYDVLGAKFTVPQLNQAISEGYVVHNDTVMGGPTVIRPSMKLILPSAKDQKS